MFHRPRPEAPSRPAETHAAGLARYAFRAACAVAAATPGLALAHPGTHGHVDLVHLVTEPDHLALLALAVGLAFWLVRRSRGAAPRRERERARRPQGREDA